MTAYISDAVNRDQKNTTSSDSHQGRSHGWSRRAFVATVATGVCGRASRRIDPFGLGQFEGVDHGRHDLPRFALKVPGETSANLRELTSAPALVDMGDGRLRGVLA
jgi:hypothetical protein